MKERIISICLLILAVITVYLIVIDLPKKNYAAPASDFIEAVKNGSSIVPPLSDSSVPIDFPAVAEEVIRLHILADSDSQTDQDIKLALRDVLLPYLHVITSNASNKEEAMVQLSSALPALTNIANTFWQNKTQIILLTFL